MEFLELTERLVDACFAVCPRSTPSREHRAAARVIAHRGAHNNAQGIIENTLEAFQLAKDAGCWGIEFDVHATADKVLVVNHDPTLQRLWGHDIAINTLRFNELRALVPAIPALAEVVAQFGTMHLFIELKAPYEDEVALVDVLQGMVPGTDYHLLSLDASIFNALSQLPKHALLLVAVHNNVGEFCRISIAEKYGGVLGNYLLLTNHKIAALKAASMHAGVGFVNSKNSLYRELNRGISWIFTNQAVAVCGYLRK